MRRSPVHLEEPSRGIFLAPLAAAPRVAHPAGKKPVWLGIIVLASVLFLLNNLGVIGGWLYPPEGYVPAFVPRAADVAQYFTWMQAFQQGGMLIPNYHAPQLTEPALLNPALWLIAKTALLLGVHLTAAYHVFHYLFYLMAAFALFYAVRQFTESAAQARAAYVAVLLAVPVQSLLYLPAFAKPGRSWSQPVSLHGAGEFVWWTSDGFFHGISGSALVTFGTAATLLAFGLLARYLRGGGRGYLFGAALTACVSAAVHPFEILVIASAGPLALLLRHGAGWRQKIADALLVGGAGLLGLLPYAVLVGRHQWLRDVAAINRWTPFPPFRLLTFLGLPMIGAIVLSLLQPKESSATDRLLKLWVACALIGLYVPLVPHAQHLLDGIHYAGALLFVRQASRSGLLSGIWARHPRMIKAFVAGLAILSLGPCVAYYRQSFRDGYAVEPAQFSCAIAPRAERLAISWIHEHARPGELVLAPRESAPWFATAPVHSLASHPLFSITYTDQVQFNDDFFGARLDRDTARELLAGYGVSYVVMPEDSPGRIYLQGAVQRAGFGSLAIFELPGNRMGRYTDRRRLQSAFRYQRAS